MSVIMVRTHMRRLYDKRGALRRLEALDRACTSRRLKVWLGCVPERVLNARSVIQLTVVEIL